MSDLPKNEKPLLDFNNSPSLSLNSPISLPSPFTDFKGMQSPGQSGSNQIIGTPDQLSTAKSHFLPTGFDFACESVYISNPNRTYNSQAEQEYKAKYGTIPKIGKALRDVQILICYWFTMF
jgi:hypothetical protein